MSYLEPGVDSLGVEVKGVGVEGNGVEGDDASSTSGAGGGGNAPLFSGLVIGVADRENGRMRCNRSAAISVRCVLRCVQIDTGPPHLTAACSQGIEERNPLGQPVDHRTVHAAVAVSNHHDGYVARQVRPTVDE